MRGKGSKPDVVNGCKLCYAVQVIHIKEEVNIGSHAPLRTVGVHFIIHPRGKLILRAPAVDMTQARTKSRMYGFNRTHDSSQTRTY